MAVKRKGLSYSVSVILDYGTNDAAKERGATFGVTTGIGGALDAEYYDANNGDEEVVDIVYGLEPYYADVISSVRLNVTYGLRSDE